MDRKHILYTLIFVLAIFSFEISLNYPIDRGINKLMLVRINDYFDKTILGEVSLHTSPTDRFYLVNYYANDDLAEHNIVPLSKVVDIKTWREIKSDNIHTQKFEDSLHIYEIYYLEDVFLNCKLKKNINISSKYEKH